MRKLIERILVIPFLAFSINTYSGGDPAKIKPTPLQEATAKPEKLVSKAKFDMPREKINESGRGYTVRLNVVGSAPKKVALVSFYTFDPGTTSKTGNTVTTKNVGSAQAAMFATTFYNKSIESLKSTFGTYGMELLTPDQYLSDADKKQAYNDFQIKNSGSSNFGNKFAQGLKNMATSGTSIVTNEAAEGFKMLKVQYDFNEPFDPNNLNDCQNNEMMESLGYDLGRSLEVDAVLVVYNTMTVQTQWFKERYKLNASSMYMFGPNPTPLPEGKKDNKYYSKGLFYCGTRISFKQDGILLNPKEPKKATPEQLAEIEKNRYNGYEKILSALAAKMGEYIKEEVVKKK